MLARLATTALVGLAAHPVGVEVDIGRGLPAVTVVGLGDTAVLQARDRIRAAFGNAGFDWPDRRVTVSLPPSDLPKHGPGFDLSKVKRDRANIGARTHVPQGADHGQARRHLRPHLARP
jgi:magnesium chelatase family protein